MELNVKDIRKLIEEKSELAQRASEAFNQLQGQVALLRDMLKNAQIEENKKKEDKKDTKEETIQEEKK
jgi:transcription elongation GreA/GreB family factor